MAGAVVAPGGKRGWRWMQRLVARPAAWRYVANGRRDLRLDFLRGFCAFAMVVDHFGGPSYLYAVTGGDSFFVSAAEAFVFLSGLMVGLVYGPRVRRDGLAAVQLRLLRRAGVLYAVTVALNLGFLALISLGLGFRDPPPLTSALVMNVLTLHWTWERVSVLVLYTLLLGVTPVALLLLHTGHTGVLVACAAGLWALHQWDPAVAQLWPPLTYFHVAAWQAWFVGGMVLGYHRAGVRALLSRVSVPAASRRPPGGGGRPRHGARDRGRAVPHPGDPRPRLRHQQGGRADRPGPRLWGVLPVGVPHAHGLVASPRAGPRVAAAPPGSACAGGLHRPRLRGGPRGPPPAGRTRPDGISRGNTLLQLAGVGTVWLVVVAWGWARPAGPRVVWPRRRRWRPAGLRLLRSSPSVASLPAPRGPARWRPDGVG